MRILNLDEAANLLGMHKETVRKYTAAKKIPGCKPGRSWRFIEDDLLGYMRSLYEKSSMVKGLDNIDRSKSQWRSSKEIKCGGLTFPTTDTEYVEALKLVKSSKHNSSMTR